MSYTERATTRTQCRKLTKFIRMVQYLFNDAVAQMVNFTTKRLLEVLEGFEEDFRELQQAQEVDPNNGGGQDKRAGPKKPNFLVECLLVEDSGLKFAPPGLVIRESIEASLREALRATSGTRTFLQCEDFLPFTAPLAELGDALQLEEQVQDLYGIVTQDPKFRDLMTMITQRYDGLFERVSIYVDGFMRFYELFQENKKLQDCNVTFADASLDDFRYELAKYKQQTEDIRAIARQKDIGLFRLDCKVLQETLAPSPARCNTLLAEYIPALTMSRQDALAKELKDANDQLAQYPSNVDDYVQFNIHLSRIDASMPNLERRYLEVQEMGEIIREYGIRIDNESRKALGDLTSSMKQVVSMVTTGKERAESDVTHFSRALDADIPELNKRVSEQAELLNNSDFANATKMSQPERQAVLELLEAIDADVKQCVDDAGRFNRYQDVLKMELTSFEDVEELKGGFAVRAKLWRGIDSWDQLNADWKATPFGTVEVEAISKSVAEYNKVAVQSSKAMPENEVANIWGTAVTQFKNTLPVVVALRNKALKGRHWELITNLIGQELDLEDDEFTLGKLLEMGVDQHMEQIQDISGKATAEQSLEEMLEKVRKTWDDQELIVNPYKDSKDVFMLGSVEDITIALEDSLVTISTIAGSRFVGPIRGEVEEWQKNLLLFQETLDEWLNVQRNWMYLESIFVAGDIKKQLPSESQKFIEVDRMWRAIMKETFEYAVAFKAATKPGRLEQFKHAAQTLDDIQKSLEDYLLSKCVAFPRFFFLSNDELLEILSQARNPKAVQPHLRKCFDNLVKLKFGDGANDITGMISGENEEIPFVKPLKARGNVEKWLSADGGVEDFMVRTMRDVVKKGWIEYRETNYRKEWVRVQYCQVMITVGSIYWTEETEDVLAAPEENKRVELMGGLYEKQKQQLSGLTELIRENLTKIQRKGVVALVTQDVHNRDIIETLYTEKVTNIMSFKWQQQLRYYWDHDVDDCLIRQVDAVINYGHEYQGALSRLVITPLTDRCWMTITGALHIKLGAAPAGPAGTGKTESVKDLAKGLARQCVVFNCSDQINYQMMGKLYSGVVSAGAWVCLDEFNRISIEVLSVVAGQVLEIRQALLQGLPDFIFEGRHLRVRPSMGIFITMNPGYAGRTELPDNLKVLFRPVAMMVPNYTLIAEIMLYAEGYASAKELSGKFTKLFSLSSEQLSKQDHYDFGMRAVKSVLVMAGGLKRSDPDENEQILLIRAMRDSNVPKFLSSDLPLFFAITQDLFPGLEVPYMDYGALQVEIEQALKKQGLQVHGTLVTKTIQLFETFNVRFGVMLVGPTLGGKTSDYRTLAMAMTQLRENGHADERYQVTRFTCFNPKSISMGELYGEFNELTQEWTDGLGSKIMRGSVMDETPDYKWTVFDGPVDAIWIENMNTVLDDNKMLCLANGERIKLPPTMTMLFEVQDLTVASPATVSRCGMVYLEPVQLGWKPFIQSWVENFKLTYPGLAEHLKKWCLEVCEKVLPFLREECKEAPGIPSVNGNLVTALLRMLSTFISPRHGFPHEVIEEGARGKPKVDKQQLALLRVYFTFSVVWSLGANLHENSRGKFQDFLKPVLQTICPEVGQDKSLSLYTIVVSDEEATFTGVSHIVPEFFFDDQVPFFNILVPTVETSLQRLLLENLMHGGYHVLFSGETGVGKSVGVQKFLNTAGESFTVASANFSAQTSSANVVDLLENRLERKRKNLLGAPPGTKMLLFIDDINMPMLEKYGAQPPIELLRQVVDYKGFYDNKKLFWKNVVDTQFIAACGPPSGGRMEVTPRLFRHYNMIWMPSLPQETMNRILSSVLGGWLMLNKPELEEFSKPIISATVDIFFKIVSDLLPTPLKCHYTFNLRDPAKMLQGILMVHVKTSLNHKEELLRLWLHEASRQFRDRLINDEDREWFNGKLADNVMKYLGEDWPAAKFRSIIYGDFFDRAEKAYVPVEEEKKLVDTFNDYLEEYNSVYPSKMNLVFFKDAQNHLARVARIIRQPRGNALLVGVSGVGRKSMARMAAHMAEYTCSSVEITRNYGSNEFREDLKAMMFDVVKNEGKGLTFLFSDTQIVKENFLEDINNILNTGEVPNLFLPDEMEQIVGLTRPLAKAAGLFDARDTIWQYFVQLVRESLHIVLAFSPVGEAFRARCRQFPSLINCATIDWYDSWPGDALVSVAKRYYAEVPADLDIAHMLGPLSSMSCVIHSSTSEAAQSFFEKLRRMTYTTPTSYLELIKLFSDLLNLKKGELITKLNRYKVGTQRLGETKNIVDKLKVDLTHMQPVIEQGKKDTAELIVQVDKEEHVAKEKQIACEVDEKEAIEAASVANAIKADCQKELDEALPEYYAAIKSLDALDKKDIQELKSFAKPPPLVEVVLQAVCLLMGKKETWDDAKKLLNDTGLLSQLREYDKDGLAANVKLTQKLQKYTKRDDFVADQVKRVSGAAMSLCLWVRAMDVYARVARSIEPKKEKLKSSEESLAAAESKLATKKAELKAVQDKVAGLQLQLMRARGKAEKLEQDAELCTIKLGRAEKLLLGLGDESVRWAAASKVLEKNLRFVVGNIMLAAGFIAYGGPFTAEFRSELVQKWLTEARQQDVTADPHWKLADVLCDPAEVREWTIRQLPADDLSVENAIMVTRGRRWPLMIDPQGQGNRWIRNQKKEANIGVIKLSTPNFLRSLETAIREGHAVLLENVEEVLDPSIEPVLLKQTFKKGGQLLLRLGSEDVPYNEDFQFFITTKMANPHYLPEICIKVTVINFTVTVAGLEDQLVNDVVAHERPDLAKLRADLVVQIAADKAEMDRLEQLILKLLSDAGEDLLADETLIVTLDQSKQTGDACKTRMASAEKSMVEIDQVTEAFRPVATRASIIYFVVADLAMIDPMYQYSLQFFKSLFQLRLERTEKAEEIRRRIEIILNDFTQFVYVKICGGLFEDHKLLFSFLFTVQILRHEVHTKFIEKTLLRFQEWMFFLRGADAGTGILNESEFPEAPFWISPAAWKKICVLERVTKAGGSDAFEGLCDSVIATPADWQSFCENDRLYDLSLPADWDARLSGFQRLLLIKSIREDFLQLAVRNFVAREVGEVYTVSPPFDLVGCFKDSLKTTPIIFVLSAGADPTDALLKLARDFEYESRLHFISLGQGQGEKAEKLIKLGRDSGDWVCLQNCHLATSWMPSLERIQETQDPDAIDNMYRLWLTSMPSMTFPVPVLQGGIKITNEPPKGLKANLARTFQDITPETYEACSKSREFKKLLFCLAFFHAAILERRKFGPIGWNVPYEWMDSDFQVSREQVHMYLESQPGVPWETLNYIIAEANYGGRVTDDKDVRLISAFLRRYFNEGVLKDGYTLSPLPDYYAPPEGSLDSVREYIRSLPMDEDPQVFGLHSNALITAQTQACNKFMDTVISVQPRLTGGGAGMKPEELVADMAKGFQGRVPALMTPKQAHAETYKKTPEGGIVSLGVFHSQERDRFNALTKKVSSSLATLGDAIKGLVVMSAQLEDMYNAFLVQKVPPLWGEPVSYPCLKPLNSWFMDFEDRVEFMSDWLTNGPPVSFWVPCFYFPQGFMTCSKQVHARKTKIPIDDLLFFSEPTDSFKDEAPKQSDGVNIHGLFIQGAGWCVEEKTIAESPKGELFVELPVIWLNVVSQADFKKLSSQAGRYRCPLYKTSLRKGTLSTTGHSTNFITWLQLPSGDEEGHWVRRGVALICMLDD
eukprot:TRINITY_DN33321_c0_g4_i1.p1 TRINITY_DN33321_c0_g4~~TRINITY_DN33321_c0_g4_i1.p1  ORF type:complete len:3770 (+),score=1255.81 TRINITY_DN33321_c0_g4_i1:195-11312(+)